MKCVQGHISSVSLAAPHASAERALIRVQAVGRSSTRLHAPPGGASQISFGDDGGGYQPPSRKGGVAKARGYGDAAGGAAKSGRTMTGDGGSQISFGGPEPVRRAEPAPRHGGGGGGGRGGSRGDYGGHSGTIRGTEGYKPSGAGGLMSSSSELGGPQVRGA